MNTVPVRTRFDAAHGFAALLDEVRDALSGALEHQSYPFDRLVDELNLPRDPSRSPLFDVMVAMQDTEATAPKLDGSIVREDDDFGGVAKFDLSVHFREAANGFDVWLEYNTDLFTAGRIHRLSGHFVTLLRAAIAARFCALGLLDLATLDEAMALRNWTAPVSPAAAGAPTVSAAFAEHVTTAPDKLAVRCGEQALTYRALDVWANDIAAHLLAVTALTPGDRVAVALHRSAALPAAILAVWKAGLVYVPIDPDYPAARQAFMLEDSGCRAIIGAVASGNLPCLDPDAAPPASSAIMAWPGPDDAAYVIYTSGSTGTPKGVVIAHRNLAAFAPVLRASFGLTSDDVVLALTTPTLIFHYWN